jgi:hypothetical protein
VDSPAGQAWTVSFDGYCRRKIGAD